MQIEYRPMLSNHMRPHHTAWTNLGTTRAPIDPRGGYEEREDTEDLRIQGIDEVDFFSEEEEDEQPEGGGSDAITSLYGHSGGGAQWGELSASTPGTASKAAPVPTKATPVPKGAIPAAEVVDTPALATPASEFVSHEERDEIIRMAREAFFAQQQLTGLHGGEMQDAVAFEATLDQIAEAEMVGMYWDSDSDGNEIHHAGDGPV